jgi:hypothetical protein
MTQADAEEPALVKTGVAQQRPLMQRDATALIDY